MNPQKLFNKFIKRYNVTFGEWKDGEFMRAEKKDKFRIIQFKFSKDETNGNVTDKEKENVWLKAIYNKLFEPSNYYPAKTEFGKQLTKAVVKIIGKFL